MHVDVEQAGSCGFASLGAAKRSHQKRNLKLSNLGVKIGAAFRQQDRFLRCDAALRYPRRQVGRHNFLVSRRNYQSLYQILQFANVAGPGVLLQRRQRVGVDSLYWCSVSRAVNLEKMFAKQRDVSRSLPEGRKLNRYHVDAIVKILAKPARSHHLLQRLIGCADKAKIDLTKCSAAQTLDVMILEHAQKLGLQRQRKRCDLIQKQRAPSAISICPGRDSVAPVNAPRSRLP